MAGIQGIKRAIVSPGFHAPDLREEVNRFEKAYFQLAEQTQNLQNHFQIFPATWAAAASPQTITLAVPTPTANYGVYAMPIVNIGVWWITARTTTTFAFNMAAPAATTVTFLVVLAD